MRDMLQILRYLRTLCSNVTQSQYSVKNEELTLFFLKWESKPPARHSGESRNDGHSFSQIPLGSCFHRSVFLLDNQISSIFKSVPQFRPPI